MPNRPYLDASVQRRIKAGQLDIEEARTALERGLRALGVYFRWYGCEFDGAERIGRILRNLDRFGVLR